MDKDLIFHPAHYIKEMMVNFELDIYDLADVMLYSGISLDEIRAVLSEKASVTEEFALALEDTFDISKETWLNLQKSYDKKREKL